VRTLPISGVGAVAVSDGQAWVDLPGRELLERLEPASGRVVGRPVHLAGSLGALAIADRRVFVADRSAGTVLCLSATTGRQIGQPVPVGGEPVSLVTAGGLVWAASLASGTVTAIDPTTVSALTAAALPDGAVRLAAGAGAVWATGQQDQLARIDPHPLAAGLAVRTTDVGTGPIGVAVGDGAVFTADLAGEAVSRVDPASLRVTATFPFGRAAAGPADAPGAGPASVAVDGDRLFVASYGEPEVSVLSARTGQPVGQPVAVPGPVTALETVGSQVWAVTANPDRLVVLSPA
jgi:streptogramin lyase